MISLFYVWPNLVTSSLAVFEVAILVKSTPLIKSCLKTRKKEKMEIKDILHKSPSTISFRLHIRAVRRRTGGRRWRWVVLWPAPSARRAFFIGGGGVALRSAAAASDRMREHWNSALAKQAFFWFYRGQPLHLWSPLGRYRRRVNCEYACCAQFHIRNELMVHCLISKVSYKCSVECWGDAESAGVENAHWKMWE